MRKWLFALVVIALFIPAVCSAQWVVGYSDSDVDMYYNDEHFAVDRYQGTPVIVVWTQTMDKEGLVSMVTKDFIDLENNRYMHHEFTAIYHRTGDAKIMPYKAIWKPIEADTPIGRLIITALNDAKTLHVVQPFTDQRTKI